MKLLLPSWQRLLLTIVVMLAAGWVAGLLWQQVFSFALPDYAAGVVGGLAALPVWDFFEALPSSDIRFLARSKEWPTFFIGIY
jgi:hypothetical protein